MPEYEVVEFARTQLTLPDKLDPADEMSWQHYLYSKLGKKEENLVQDALEKPDKKPGNKIEDTVDRIVAMAKVLYGLHMVSIPICPVSPSLFCPLSVPNHSPFHSEVKYI